MSKLVLCDIMHIYVLLSLYHQKVVLLFANKSMYLYVLLYLALKRLLFKENQPNCKYSTTITSPYYCNSAGTVKDDYCYKDTAEGCQHRVITPGGTKPCRLL